MAENQATDSTKFSNVVKMVEETLKQVGYVTSINSLMAV